nr:WD repeat-containing protein 43 [Leptinotarsa decemlineata]
MAETMALQFCENGKYFAGISTDGKLKIWNTLTNSFEQEFIPDFHLTSPCTCLHFMETNSLKYKGASPKKKKRKDSGTNFGPKIVLGTTAGLLLVYSISKGNLECTLNSETSQSLICLSSANYKEIYSGAEQYVFEWNLEKKTLVSKWKAGNEKVTAVLAIPDSKQVITAAKNISLWDVDAKEILRTFTGHSSEVTLLHFVTPQSKRDSYFISGSKDDRLLNCWSLSDGSNEKNAVASFLMEDIVQNVSIHVGADGSTNLAATVRSGVVHIFQHTLNGKCGKPLKPKTTIQVVSDAGHSKNTVTPIRIFGAIYRDDDSLCIGHGTEIVLTFENVSIVSPKRHLCLVRKDPRTLAISKPDEQSKTITPIVGNDVHYLTSQTSSISTKKRKNDGRLEVPMEKRLENLELNKADGDSKIPKSNNVAQLLVQGLHSKDKNILRTVLCKREENVIRNTIKRLNITVLVPLIQELSVFIEGKTLSSQIGAIWFKHILQIHAGILMSNPDLSDLFGSTLGSIASRLAPLTPLNMLKGRLELLLPQVGGSSHEENENEEPLLVYNDKESSDSEEDDIAMDVHSESENEWEEDSSEEDHNEENDVGSEIESDSDSS